MAVAGPAILVSNVVKQYGQVRALEGISFEVPPGSVFGLLGPNGAGKTTIVRILATTLGLDSGRAEVMGYDVGRDASSVRSIIGLAGQYAAVDANLTGEENLTLVGKLAQLPWKEARRRADELLDRFNLSDAGKRTVKTYSGGMRRRLDVAAALVQRPPVIFLDEPTTGLDIQSRTELWALIKELVADGAAVLLTTQYLEEADRLADRVAVLDHGRVVADDTPAALKARLGTTVIELSMADSAVAERARLVIGSFSDKLEVDGSTLRLPSTGDPRLLFDLLTALEAQDLLPATLSVHEPSLDDIFLSLTGHRAEDAAAVAAEASITAGRRGAR